MSHVSVEVIAPVLTNFFHCAHCEQIFNHAGIGQQVHGEELDQYPQEVKHEAARLASWLFELTCHYGDQVHIRVVDAQSLEGLFKSLRYWVRRYPTFIINGREKIVGWDQAALDAALQARLTAR